MLSPINFDVLIQEMVDRQLLSRGINDPRVIEVFRKIPRHKFVPAEYQKSSYGDFPLPIGQDQTISQPYIVALMTQALELKDTDIALEIGTGSGYQTAILANLAKFVYSVERIEPLGKRAEVTLKEIGVENFKIKVDDGTLGWKEFAPYDKIIITAAAPHLPKTLCEQLKESAKLVIPLSRGFGQELVLYTKEKDSFIQKEICGCTFVPLIGKYGFKQ